MFVVPIGCVGPASHRGSHIKTLCSVALLSLSCAPYTKCIYSIYYNTYAVHQAARHSENPTEKDVTACKRILRYLSTTPDLGITYGAEGASELRGYVDADWAEDVVSCKSTTSYVFKLNEVAISCCNQLEL